MLPEIITGFSGLLFIGDLHLSSLRVGRRTDDYATAILDKVAQAAEICRARNLAPVFLGDVFHRARENDLALLNRVIAQSRAFPTKPIVVRGSHDPVETHLTECDALTLVGNVGAMQVIDDTGLAARFDIAGQRVVLWATPAKEVLPTDLSEEEGFEHGAFNIMLTHHDMDFNGRYPGAVELRPIRGCNMLVNGHMHTPAPQIIRGHMVCHNPGSLSRDAINLKDHKPVVSVWTPAHCSSLEAVPLRVAAAREVFDFTGKEVAAASVTELKASLPKAMALSKFATLLEGDQSLEAAGTDDGTVLLDELAEYFDSTTMQNASALRAYLTELVQSVVAERVAA